jgi:hypothetical protein
MNGATAVQVAESDGPNDEAPASRNDISAFFAAVATLQRETISRFEETVGRLTGLAMTSADSTDRELIMTLQDFDRLQQEFAALGEVLARFGTIMGNLLSSHNLSDHLDRHVIADISVGDLKDRLLHYYRSDPGELEASVIDEAEF